MGKVTSRIIKYKNETEPNFVLPEMYMPYRYWLGRTGKNPIVCIGMNPSAAKEEYSDATVNKVIATGKKHGYDGWIMLNIYPERATDAKTLNDYNDEIHNQNITNIIKILKDNNIGEIWGAWGDIDEKNKWISKVKFEVINALKKNNIKIYYFGELTKKYKNPKHPLYLKIDINDKKYY